MATEENERDMARQARRRAAAVLLLLILLSLLLHLGCCGDANGGLAQFQEVGRSEEIYCIHSHCWSSSLSGHARCAYASKIDAASKRVRKCVLLLLVRCARCTCQ